MSHSCLRGNPQRVCFPAAAAVAKCVVPCIRPVTLRLTSGPHFRLLGTRTIPGMCHAGTARPRGRGPTHNDPAGSLFLFQSQKGRCSNSGSSTWNFHFSGHVCSSEPWAKTQRGFHSGESEVVLRHRSLPPALRGPLAPGGQDPCLSV